MLVTEVVPLDIVSGNRPGAQEEHRKLRRLEGFAVKQGGWRNVETGLES